MKRENANIIFMYFFMLSFITFIGCIKQTEDPMISDSMPTLETDNAGSSDPTSAYVYWEIFSGGITECGVVWSTSQMPTINDNRTRENYKFGKKLSKCTGLIPNTTYYIRAYATNNIGTAYGDEKSVTTGQFSRCGIVTDADGNNYNTITIGTQCWMRENLRSSKYSDSTAIPNITDNATWNNTTTGAYSDYNNSVLNSDKYGRLYNWYAVADTHKLCPTGWHLPNNDEWALLISTAINYGVNDINIVDLKESGTEHWESPNVTTGNTRDFTALPGGYRDNNGTFNFAAINGFWWTSTALNATNSFAYSLHYDNVIVYKNNFNKNNGFSVRCVKDE